MWKFLVFNETNRRIRAFYLFEVFKRRSNHSDIRSFALSRGWRLCKPYRDKYLFDFWWINSWGAWWLRQVQILITFLFESLGGYEKSIARLIGIGESMVSACINSMYNKNQRMWGIWTQFSFLGSLFINHQCYITS